MTPKTSILILLTVGLTACVQRSHIPSDKVQAMCKQIAEVYPAATLQDIYKTCYQDFFGAEHLMQDTAAARAYLHYELNQLKSEGVNETRMPMCEPTGFRHRFQRINLALVLNGTMSEEELLLLFIDAAGDEGMNELRSEGMNDWSEEWNEIERIALTVQPAWQDDELQGLLREAATNKQAVRHSESFRNTYKPHYRIIRL